MEMKGAHIWGSFRLLSSVCAWGGGFRGSQSDVCVYVCDQLAVGVEEERIKKTKGKF